MAGGKITRIIKGVNSLECDTWTVYTDKFTAYANNGSHFTADKGTSFGEPKDAKTKGPYLIRGYWTDEKDNVITEALIGETVKFHVETKDIPDGGKIELLLFDDDSQNNESINDENAQQIPLYPTLNGEANMKADESKFVIVSNNKAEKTIILNEYFTWLTSQENDKTVELYFSCVYENQKERFPILFQDYLKVKGMPKIIFVNGQWKLASKVPFGIGENFGPTEPKKPYWSNGIASKFLDYLKDNYNLDSQFIFKGNKLKSDELEFKKIILYYDGSSDWGMDESGGDRFINGRKFAEENFDEITKGLGKNEVFLVSHSEGGAYAAGMADFLHEKGIKIGEHILLSPDEGDGFTINPEIPSYQLTYMFFSSVWNPMGAIINSEKQKQFNKQFRQWGKYYAIVDWVTNEFRVQGTKKMGIAHVQDSGWEGVHGWTNSSMIFNKIADLKEVSVFDAIGEKNGDVYSGKDHSVASNETIFYRIDDEYISVKCPPIEEIK